MALTDFVIDAEFIELEQEIDLISLGLVSEHGREFYAISTQFDPARANDFVRTLVLPLLEPRDSHVWMSRAEIKDALIAFVGDAVPRFWAWGGAPYDWMVIAQLFPTVERMPDRWLYTAYDIPQLVERAGLTIDPLDPTLPQPPTGSHHALTDARWANSILRRVKQAPRNVPHQ